MDTVGVTFCCHYELPVASVVNVGMTFVNALPVQSRLLSASK
jgi:hypothetical protein